MLSDFDKHLIAEGRHLRLAEALGSHPAVVDGQRGVRFAVWAPNARAVSVIGDFNHWQADEHPLRSDWSCGIWEGFVAGLGPGALYKFAIRTCAGDLLEKADPVARAAETPPRTASIVADTAPLPWSDAPWLERRGQAIAIDAPVSIYECHLGSWQRVPEDGHRSLSYRELADRLVPYVAEQGFTHVELLPLAEYPFGGSWGYQPLGLFAPTARYGSPQDFALLVNAFHQAGIGVLVDWVPAHFPGDAHGLVRFDGTPLYEHASPLEGFHPDWHSFIYNYGRREVSNLLRASAVHWLQHFHVDGLRVDAVASMLYRDYSREGGEWIPNVYGGRENLEAVDFLKSLNTDAYGAVPGIAMVAEESTAWPGVTAPVHHGGLGFGYKWNLGWMHDSLGYMQHDPIHRRYHHHEMTMSLLYSFSENYILPLSHDEVVHGKGSLLARMPGDRWQRLANLRAYYAWMFGHPGKKLLFMGSEFAQEGEWTHDHSLDWHLLEREEHRGVQRLIRDLNAAYRGSPALYRRERDPEAFRWIELFDAANSVFAFERFGHPSDAPVVVVSNMTPVVREDYRIGVSCPGTYLETVNTDSVAYAGSNVGNHGSVRSEALGAHGRCHSLCLTLPPLATLILKRGAT